MATINDLDKSISEASDDELLERLRALRLSRRTHKPTTSTRTRKQATPKLGAKSMTLEQTKALIAELEELMNES